MNTSTSAMDNGCDLVMTAADFDRIRKLIHQRAGIALAVHKGGMAYSRLARRLRPLGMRYFADYIAALDADSNNPEWEHFINALTTNLTSFFREAHHFPVLAEHGRLHADGGYRVWSCAVSTGEEAYSIAIVLAETLGVRSQSVRILGTDIDTGALSTAAAGMYQYDAVRTLDPQRLQRFFLQGTGSRAGMVRVRSDLRDMVEFGATNLAAREWGVSGLFDAIFCRNIMIYFDTATQKTVLERLAGLLKPGGLLFAGHSENLSGLTASLTLRANTVYEAVPHVRKAI